MARTEQFKKRMRQFKEGQDFTDEGVDASSPLEKPPFDFSPTAPIVELVDSAPELVDSTDTKVPLSALRPDQIERLTSVTDMDEGMPLGVFKLNPAPTKKVKRSTCTKEIKCTDDKCITTTCGPEPTPIVEDPVDEEVDGEIRVMPGAQPLVGLIAPGSYTAIELKNPDPSVARPHKVKVLMQQTGDMAEDMKRAKYLEKIMAGLSANTKMTEGEE